MTDPGVPKDHTARLAVLRRAMIPWLAGIDPETKTPRRQVARFTDIPDEARPLVEHFVAAAAAGDRRLGRHRRAHNRAGARGAAQAMGPDRRVAQGRTLQRSRRLKAFAAPRATGMPTNATTIGWPTPAAGSTMPRRSNRAPISPAGWIQPTSPISTPRALRRLPGGTGSSTKQGNSPRRESSRCAGHGSAPLRPCCSRSWPACSAGSA